LITAFAQLLRELQLREAAVLADQKDIRHAPTIGNMYEGLTRNLLDRAIPESAGVRIVDGFVVGPDGTLSPQLDCMLVVGDGQQIPYTQHYKWPVQAVVAVFEIKKNLYAAELADSYEKLRNVLASYSLWIEMHHDEDATVSISATFHAFAKLTGRYLKSYDEASSLPEALEFMFHTLVMEQLSPLRIVFGYDGYADEYGLREGLCGYLEARQGKRGYGVGSLPNLIICGRNSLLKLTGHPYLAPTDDSEWWNVVASNAENPLRLLLELLWTKMSYVTPMGMQLEDTLRREALHVFLSARVARSGDQIGWEYSYNTISRDKLIASDQGAFWAPEPIDSKEFSFLSVLVRKGTENILDPNFVAWAGKHGLDISAFLDQLVERRLIARNGNEVRLADEELYFAFAPDGQAWAATDENLLNLWIIRLSSSANPANDG
jgi:hypothetical protein